MPATTPPDIQVQWMHASGALAERVEFLLWTPPEAAAREHEVTPDANADLLIEVSETGCRALLYGPVTRLTRVPTRAGRGHAVVHFRPGAMPLLVDANPAELVDGVAELRHVAGVPVDALGEQLMRAGSEAARAQVLLGMLRRVAWPERGTFDRALSRWAAQGASSRVAELAGMLHLSPRTLERAFRERVGLPPRTFQRILRLQAALSALRAGSQRTLAEVALASGYADHAHLTREFRAMTGRTPSEFRTGR